MVLAVFIPVKKDFFISELLNFSSEDMGLNFFKSKMADCFSSLDCD